MENKLSKALSFIEGFLMHTGASGILLCDQQDDFQKLVCTTAILELDRDKILIAALHNDVWIDCGTGVISISKNLETGFYSIRWAHGGIMREFSPILVNIDTLEVIVDTTVAVEELRNYLEMVQMAGSLLSDHKGRFPN